MSPITLPLPDTMARCLAEGHIHPQKCERASHCARYLSIELDTEPVMVRNRACSSDLMAAYIPIDGFPTEDDNA